MDVDCHIYRQTESQERPVMFKAFILEQDDTGKTISRISEIDEDFLDTQGEVLVRVEYAGVNYKDGPVLVIHTGIFHAH